MATSASAGQVLGSVAAMCAAGGAMYYAINVARVFGGASSTTTRTPTEGCAGDREEIETDDDDDGDDAFERAGETPSTINKEWAQATAERAKSWPREGSETPIALDPMSGARRA